MKDENFIKYLNKAYFFLKFRPRSEKEIKHYLIKKTSKLSHSSSLIEEVINELKEEKLVDDGNFISWFVDQRNRSKPKSVFVLKRELMRFGISKDKIENFFQLNQTDENQLAIQALTKKKSSLRNYPHQEQFKKAIGFLLRRGFSYEIAKKAYQSIFHLKI